MDETARKVALRDAARAHDWTLCVEQALVIHRLDESGPSPHITSPEYLRAVVLRLVPELPLAFLDKMIPPTPNPPATLPEDGPTEGDFCRAVEGQRAWILRNDPDWLVIHFASGHELHVQTGVCFVWPDPGKAN